MKAKQIILLLFTFAIAGCSTYSAPIITRDQPPSIRITTHQVAEGDTLYSIAWRYDLNVRLLAKANRISQPYTIGKGQVLSLNTTGVSLGEPIPISAQNKPVGRAQPSSVAKSPPKPMVYSKNLRWQWPVKGKVIKGYSPKDLRKGLSIKSNAGPGVRPAAPGIVVYVGDGLRGYGKLVIIKHSEILLSAYAHNEKILVKEGQTVKSMETISKLGPKETLYFEIRKDGYPVNPTVYID
ncbi:MAG: peptidoglycan DD-metalloendopeptidase family protein [Porticoccaceae bacterium]|jgi:lipoprotein NlpD|nr:peptidoglycan DD-metalloendopeptidase family protein [Porticoccaceae bacterium]MDG1310912.1 peptidoglycan DD-metalloendopeptidase family protein [Porticoccaceae bacterium]